MRWVLIAVAVASSMPAAPASGAPGHAEIAFVRGFEIWAARADGSERRLLVASPRRREALVEPAWSPDGSMLAFARTTLTARRWRSEIVTRVLATGAERTLVGVRVGARFDQVGEPAWSQDGSAIAYTRYGLDSEHRFRPAIRVLPAAGEESRTLIRDAQLRPLGNSRPVRRLARPRVPRAVARRLELTARARRRHANGAETARALGIERFEVEGRLRLRRALRSLGPYRYASCSSARSR